MAGIAADATALLRDPSLGEEAAAAAVMKVARWLVGDAAAGLEEYALSLHAGRVFHSILEGLPLEKDRRDVAESAVGLAADGFRCAGTGTKAVWGGVRPMLLRPGEVRREVNGAIQNIAYFAALFEGADMPSAARAQTVTASLWQDPEALRAALGEVLAAPPPGGP